MQRRVKPFREQWMQMIQKKIIRFNVPAALLLSVVTSIGFFSNAFAACTFFSDFKDNKNGTVTDPRSGLEWKRCAEGFALKESGCVGGSAKSNWFDAMKAAKSSRFLGKNDWRLPTKQELSAVMGEESDCEDNDEEKSQYAASSLIAHPVEGKFPGEFWSSSPGNNDSEVWVGRFFKGRLLSSPRSTVAFKTRLVRDGLASTSSASSEFERERTKTNDYKSATQAEDRRRRQDFLDAEAKKGIYSPEYKAQKKRETEQASQVKQLCLAQKTTCTAACGSPSYWNGNRYVENQGWSRCDQSCSSINCN
jgi:hypothetical protein